MDDWVKDFKSVTDSLEKIEGMLDQGEEPEAEVKYSVICTALVTEDLYPAAATVSDDVCHT